jgi:5-methylcytosine-specific restriction protein B
MPKYDILEKEIDGINIGKFLQALNERIEIIFDRDHMIGHAYFINIKTKEELDGVMKNKIIPLLQEYFYDDWEKIQIVLGDFKTQKIDNKDVDDADRFVISKNVNENKVLGFEYEDIDEEQKIFEINDDFTNQAYTKVYGYI